MTKLGDFDKGMSRGVMSALTPKADILRVVEKCLLMTRSGHSFFHAIDQIFL